MSNKRYVSDIPNLMLEWHPTKNVELDPMKITIGSSRKVWWLCNKGHEWQSSIVSRANDSKCPYCSGRKVLKGFNDLQTTHPTLCLEWNYVKNEITPDTVSKGSVKRVWWKCQFGHEWEATINSRTNKNNGCPVCHNKKVVQGVNDLHTLYPSICEEWDYERNGELLPNNFTKGADRIVWWKCKKGHSWKAHIYERTSGRNCPYCSKDAQTSFPEKCVFFYISKSFQDTIANYKPDFLQGKELDIFIPNLNTAIEYDGKRWHSNLMRDVSKNQACEQNRIRLIRIREKGCPSDLTEYQYVKYINLNENSENELQHAIQAVFELLGQADCDINIERDRIRILETLLTSAKQNSIIENQDLLQEWNYSKNGDIDPNYIKIQSNQKYWWLCKNGHEWRATPYSRYRGNGCPHCSGHKVLAGYNDLMTLYPELCLEWDYDKNKDQSPTMFTSKSNKYVWWKCSNGHSWQAQISKRTSLRGCPICSKSKRVATHSSNYLKTHDSLEITHPALCLEWDFDKNATILPSEVTSGSNKKVWWKCRKGHSWQAKIASRVRGNNCPVCGGKMIIAGINDLATLKPDLIKDWDFEKNEINPKSIGVNTHQRVWWKCHICGHQWSTQVHSRTGKEGTNCPNCHRRKQHQ